tara:strand:- start:19644 stop:19793 length:150 start_codon:yes stop_codon:yes gene_type:complete
MSKIELENLIKKEEDNLRAAKECKLNIEKSIYDTEQYLIMYKNRLKKLT